MYCSGGIIFTRDVPVDATEKAIKKAYRTMAVKHHPDKHSPEEAEVSAVFFIN